MTLMAIFDAGYYVLIHERGDQLCLTNNMAVMSCWDVHEKAAGHMRRVLNMLGHYVAILNYGRTT